jgi:predicted DNA-binding transcriptional regulator AlpA
MNQRAYAHLNSVPPSAPSPRSSAPRFFAGCVVAADPPDPAPPPPEQRDPSQDQAPLDPQARRFAYARAMLVRDFNIDSAFVDMPKLARILGCSAATLWAYIRKGEFFMPYRKIHGGLAVSVDDLAAWYSSATGVVAPSDGAGVWPAHCGGDAAEPPSPSKKGRAAQAVDEAIAQAYASLGGRRRRGRPKSA